MAHTAFHEARTVAVVALTGGGERSAANPASAFALRTFHRTFSVACLACGHFVISFLVLGLVLIEPISAADRTD